MKNYSKIYLNSIFLIGSLYFPSTATPLDQIYFNRAHIVKQLQQLNDIDN